MILKLYTGTVLTFAR